MRKLNENLIRIALMMILGVGVVLVSCDGDDEPGGETFADPTIAITSPEVLTGLQVLVGGPIDFEIMVEAEAGLSSVSLNGSSIKTYTGEETSDTFTHTVTGAEAGTTSLEFAVEDAQGTVISATAISLEVIGEAGLLVADFGGVESTTTTLSTIDTAHWDGVREIVSFSVSGGVASNATHENVGNQFSVEIGAANPDAEASIEYQGKAMKIVKQPGDWGTDGWGHIIIGFDQAFSASDIEALPQVNADLNGLVAGTKVIKVDAYYDDTQNDTLKMANFKALTEIWNADPSKGYLIDLTLAKLDVHRLNHDGAGMHIGYQAYVSEANTWQTITFDALDLGRVGNFLAADDPGKESPSSSEVDAIRLIPGGGYGDGQTANALYLRNLRIVDVE